MTRQYRHAPETPSERSQRARIAGLALAAQRDGATISAPARKAFLARFEAQVDPDGTLPPAERTRRAEAAKKAHMARLALASARARRQRAGRRT